MTLIPVMKSWRYWEMFAKPAAQKGHSGPHEVTWLIWIWLSLWVGYKSWILLYCYKEGISHVNNSLWRWALSSFVGTKHHRAHCTLVQAQMDQRCHLDLGTMKAREWWREKYFSYLGFNLAALDGRWCLSLWQDKRISWDIERSTKHQRLCLSCEIALMSPFHCLLKK